MFENDITCDYFIKKGIMALLFTAEYEEAFTTIASDLYIDYDNFLVILRDLVKCYCLVFDDDVKANLDSINEYFRYDYCDEHPEEKEKVYEAINEIVRIRNSSNLSGLGMFVFNELISRYGRNSVLGISYNQNKLMKEYTKIKFLMEYDYCILSSHSEMVDEDEFNDVAEDFADINSFYVICLNRILNECPEVLKDEIFKKRAKLILHLIGENLVSDKNGKTDEPLKKLLQRYNDCCSKIEYYEDLYKATEKKL